MSSSRFVVSRRSLLSSAMGGLSLLALGPASRALAGVPKAGKKAPLPKFIGSPSVKSDLKLTAAQREVAEALLGKARHALSSVAKDPGKAYKSPLAKASKRALELVSSKRAGRAKSRASALLDAPSAQKVKLFGPYAKVSPTGHMALKEADSPILDRVMTLKKVELTKVKKWSPPEDSGGASMVQMYTKIEFHLNSLECKETTDGGGADEIRFDGWVYEPNGNRVEFPRVSHDNFYKDQIRYHDCALYTEMGAVAAEATGVQCHNGSPNDKYRGKKLASSSLAGPWPGTYGAVFVMGEHDSGGFGDILREIYDAVQDELERYAAEAGILIGSAIGSAIGGVGAVIGAIIGWVVGEFIEWLCGLFDDKDDFVAAKSWTVQFADRSKDTMRAAVSQPLPTPAGVLASDMKQLPFYGDGGRYLVRMHWRAS